jgi:type II secretory pathway pseudopilin PulG
VSAVPPPTRRRRSQEGLTLIELIVSVALLALVGGVIGTVFSVSLKALGDHGATARLSGARDQMAFEQALGRDVARAACIQVRGGTTYGSCSTGFASAAGASCTQALLCVGWPQGSYPQYTCHVAAYSLAANSEVKRTEYAAQTGGPPTTVGLTTDSVAIAITALSPLVHVSTPAGGGYDWVGRLQVTITNLGVSGVPPTDTLVLEPLASDPAGDGAKITKTGPPC